MSITLTVHDWKHRITKTGLFQSCPTDKENDWQTRKQEEMNLTGGDIDLLRNTIKRISECIPQDYKLPHAEKAKEGELIYPNEEFI